MTLSDVPFDRSLKGIIRRSKKKSAQSVALIDLKFHLTLKIEHARTFQLNTIANQSRQAWKQSVPPRSSGWVRSLNFRIGLRLLALRNRQRLGFFSRGLPLK